MSLKQKAIKGLVWTVLGYGFSQALRLGSNIILTRLLVPEVFGMISLVNSFFVGLNLFSDVGIGPSIIQSKKGEQANFYNTAWTLQVVRGFGIWVISILIAYPISVFYQTPILKWLIPIVSLNAVIMGFQSISIFVLDRHINVLKKNLFQIVIQIIGIVIMIVGAYYNPTIWPLIIGTTIANLAATIISHKLIPEIVNSFAWDKNVLTELLSFGKWIFISTTMTFLAMQSDRLILSKLFSIEMLGIYVIAFTFADLPVQVIDKINGLIVFPLVSKLSELPRNILKEKILGKRKFLLLFAIILTAFLTSFGDLIISIFYDDKYKEAMWMLPLLSLGIWPNVLGVTMRSVQLGIGKPIYGAYGYFLKFLYMITLLPLISNLFGIKGAILAIAFNDIPFYFAVQYGLWREKMMSLKQDINSSLILILVISICLWFRSYIKWGSPFNVF